MSLALASALALLATAVGAKQVPTPLDGFLASVSRTTLPNGLTLIVREQPGTGVVAIDTWVEAGYFNEPDEVAGMAHLFEHMFFKGSKAFPGAERIAQELAAVGGESNAGTIYDSTNYYFVVPKEGFRRAAEIMADAIAHPLFDPAELKKEAEVVIEESNRKLDNPPALSLERMFATSYTQHRFRRWRIGSNEVLRAIQRDNLLAFFDTLYRPANLIVVVAGDITRKDAEAAARATFGAIPAGKVVRHPGPKEPEQAEFRYGRSTGDLKQGYSVLGWHTQGVGGADEQALDLAAQILGGGRSSRLFRHAVGPDAAATAFASHQQFEDVGIFVVQASFDEPKRDEVDRRLLGEIERLKAHGPTPYELQLAKNTLEAQVVLGLESALGQVQTLGQTEARYGYRDLGVRLAALRAVTADQIRDAARRYFTNDKLTLYAYSPKGAPEVDASAELAQVKAATAAPPPAEAAAELPPAPVPVAPARADRAAQSIVLPGGATLIVRERPGAPSVSVGVYLRGGRSDESTADAGVTQLATASLRRGTATRSGEEIDGALEFLGTELVNDVQPDYFGLRFDVLASNLRPALDLVSDLVLHPAFPTQGVEEERALQLAAIRRSFDSSSARPIELALRALLPTHPYGLPTNGTEDSASRLDAARLDAFWRDHLAAEDAVILVVGDVAADDARVLFEKAFAGLPRRGSARAAVRAPLAPVSRLETVEFRNRKQSAIVMLFPAPAASDADAPRLALLQNIASGLSGTLFAELRGKRSLAYTVFASYLPRRSGGLGFAYLATEAKKEGEAKDALLTELRRFATDGFSQADLDRGKSSFAGSTRIDLETNGGLLADLAGNQLLGLGLDATEKKLAAVKATTLEEVRATAAKVFSSENFATAILRGKTGS
jgi:zinc protease